MNDEVLVRVEGVSKKFCRSLKKSLWYGVRDIVSDLNPFAPSANGGPHDNSHATTDAGLRPDEFWAVYDVSFELRRGECLGLIGRNGAGKTTLLKMLNGLIKPDHGRIEMRGRVGALIALGAGFNPILTGRENIYVNGSVLGLTRKEIDAKVDDIIDFADIREFIDSPVQSYSSGMNVRLGFAIATALEPDVLILDEVLAVGDAVFRYKCYNRIADIQKSAAVIFVSHSMEQVAQICTSVLVLNRGRRDFLGETQSGVQNYELDYSNNSNESGFLQTHEPVFGASIRTNKATISYGEVLELLCHFQCNAPSGYIRFRVQFYELGGHPSAEALTNDDSSLHRFEGGENDVRVEIGPLHLRAGQYLLSVLVYNDSRTTIYCWSYKQVSINVLGVRWCSTAYEIPVIKVSSTFDPNSARTTTDELFRSIVETT